MQVFDTRKISTISFKDIHIGSSFFDAKVGVYAMRIPNFDGLTNAVCLKTGKLYFYKEEDEVTPVKAKVEVYA